MTITGFCGIVIKSSQEKADGFLNSACFGFAALTLHNAFTRHRRVIAVEFRAAVNAAEDKQIEEMHSA